MALSSTAIVAMFTEFAAADETNWLVLAAEYLDSSLWGSRYSKGVAFLAMHFMARAGLSSEESTAGSGGGAAGAVTSEKAGDVARSYGKASVKPGETSDEDLMGTKFGRMFLDLRAGLECTAPSTTNLTGITVTSEVT